VSWRLVDGVPLPDAIGGHPALDFCNTRAGWGTATPKEYLTSPAALALWCREAGLLTADAVQPLLTAPAASPAPSSADHARNAHQAPSSAAARVTPPTQLTPADTLGRAGALREAVYACALGRGTAGDWALVSLEATAARAASELVPDPTGGPARWRLRAAPLDPGDRHPAGDLPDISGTFPAGRRSRTLPLHAVALAAEDLLTSALAGRVRACPGAGCGWLFVDPRGRRRWCSMAVCGNRAKARRYAVRHAAPAQ
jgi:hypothetical protein